MPRLWLLRSEVFFKVGVVDYWGMCSTASVLGSLRLGRGPTPCAFPSSANPTFSEIAAQVLAAPWGSNVGSQAD